MHCHHWWRRLNRNMELRNPDHAGTEFFAALEGMRGLAALGVVFYHMLWHWHLYGSSVIRHGFLFVDLFFIISGFVISHIYAARLRSARELGEFALLRTARLYPLHLATLLLVAGLTLLAARLATLGGPFVVLAKEPMLAHNTPKEFFHSLVLLQAVLPHPSTYSFNRPSWSISVEYCTYVAFALAALLASGRRSWLVAMASVTAVLTAVALWGHGGLASGAPLLRCLLSFSCGVLLQFAWRQGHRAARTRLRDGWVPHAAETLCLLLIVTVMSRFGDHREQFLVIPVFAAGVLLLTLSRGWLTRLLETPAVQYLGRSSYSIYMIHFPLLLLFSGGLELYGYSQSPGHVTEMAEWARYGVSLVYVATVIAVSGVTYRFIEVPPRAWAKRLMAGRRPAARAAAPAGADGG